MTDLMEIIKKRRSIRKYEEKDIPVEIVDKVLEAVRWTPSWVLLL
jgi:nitroreductase